MGEQFFFFFMIHVLTFDVSSISHNSCELLKLFKTACHGPLPVPADTCMHKLSLSLASTRNMYTYNPTCPHGRIQMTETRSKPRSICNGHYLTYLRIKEACKWRESE